MRTVIVGGGACGASCAARLRRLDETAEIIILEATDEISIANCGLPYYCSDVINGRDKMIVAKPDTFKNLLNVEVRFNSKVTAINKNKKTVTVNHDYELSYDNLVLAPGASPVKPPIPGIDNKKIFTVRTLRDADMIKMHIKSANAKNAVVIGGGFIGVEMAENLVTMGLKTTVVEAASQILAPFDKDMMALAHNEMRDKGCKLIFNDGVKAFTENEIELASGRHIPYDIAILGIGVQPDTQIVKEADLETGLNGLIKVNEFLQTSDENIWAGGDAVEDIDFVTGKSAMIPMAGPANRHGRLIADNITAAAAGKEKTSFKPVLGTSVAKIFNKTFACSGKNEKQLIKEGIKYIKNITQTNDHAGYYPNARPLYVKLLFTEEGKILGVQAAGYEGVEKRVDVIATVMRLNGNIQDLIDAELSYAPPYSSAKDPVNIAGMSAQNILDGLYKPAFFEDVKDSLLIDVRVEEMFNTKTIDGAISVPAVQMRKRFNEIPRDKKVVLFCNRGFTSYVAIRILNQLGFNNLYSLCGGINLYSEILKDKKADRTDEKLPV
ncbi:FAD-dependent oxidoreductase [Spirochaetes bacterium]|uniref:FAD-dependent oxidoreductase n=1 Tax=Candidatus Scatousia excrementipullorum TaxID=2840936 RepID=A0A9D9H0A5_9BACT|nr:FAD-dependent oxidoreductase [Candidatus Scatousia excrementipullorum]